MFTNRFACVMDLLETKSAAALSSEDISDDEACVLPADTMLILQQFLQEKESKERSEKAGAEPAGCFEENWQLSQFWYNEKTKQKIALIVRNLQDESTSDTFQVALLSAPSAFKHVVNENQQAMLFEFDERFASYGDNFQQYDYNRAYDAGYMDAFADKFDLIIADPPFLSEECIEKIGAIVKKISKQNAKIVLCSGAVVQEWAKEHLGVRLCQFRPEHERNLGNEFHSYANFDLDSILNKGV
ncbi:protein-lysine N-methyltransferase CG9154 [Anopheles maculipalpis]|uniref:protein-lysine N-methyltransferase CG9154 n=1 Tax=Anopheles maculipalpis TaxID=1496333 RepID=UPI002158AE93|nr:protein-lysine N-methyltransferase CG9154 [Anopheles maculipalpis]